MNRPEYLCTSTSASTAGSTGSSSVNGVKPDMIYRLYRLQSDLKSFNIKGVWKHFAIALAELIEYKFPEALDGKDIVLSAAMPCAETLIDTGDNSVWARTVYRVRCSDGRLWIGCENPRDRNEDCMPKAAQSPMCDKETSGLIIGTGVNYVQVVTGSSVPVENLYLIPTDDDCDSDWWELNGFNLCGALIGTLHDLSDTNSYWYSHMKHGYSNDTGSVSYSNFVST